MYKGKKEVKNDFPLKLKTCLKIKFHRNNKYISFLDGTDESKLFIHWQKKKSRDST